MHNYKQIFGASSVTKLFNPPPQKKKKGNKHLHLFLWWRVIYKNKNITTATRLKEGSQITSSNTEDKMKKLSDLIRISRLLITIHKFQFLLLFKHIVCLLLDLEHWWLWLGNIFPQILFLVIPTHINTRGYIEITWSVCPSIRPSVHL